MKREVVSMAFVLLLFLMMFSSLPLVSAAYTVEYASFPPDLPGDIDSDSYVGIFDIFMVASAFGGVFYDDLWNPLCDVDADGYVGISDLFSVVSLFGTEYLMSPTPVAYSTSFEFDVQNDGDAPVWYYVLVRFYVPEALSNEAFNLTAGKSVDDGVRNVRVDTNMVWSSQVGGFFNISFGQLLEGYHLLELEYLESNGGGLINFFIKTANNEYAQLDRFRVYVPNYSDEPYEYTVTTHTWCSMKDDYFLIGYADDCIDDVHVDGLVWQDWMWDMGNYGAIYAWGDGFCYPMGNLENNIGLNAYSISFEFGEIWCGGLLDFQIVSWTNQRDRIGKPKFYATLDFTPSNFEKHTPFFNETLNVYNATFYGGSQWKDAEHPEISERNFETQLKLNAYWNRTYAYNVLPSEYFDTCLEVGLGNGWAEWALTPGATNDLGITMNLTCLSFNTNLPSKESGSEAICLQWCATLQNVTIDIFSYPWVEIPAIECYPNGESIVKPDWTVATDYLGTLIMFVSTALATGGIFTPVQAVIGSLVGVAVKGVTTSSHYTQGQTLEAYQETVTELHHRQLQYSDHIDSNGNDAYGPLKIFAPDNHPMSSDNDAVFLQLNPISAKRCGLTKVVLKGQLSVLFYTIYMPYKTPEWVDFTVPLGELEIAIYIPWFI